MDFPMISLDFLEIAEIPRRAHWPRTTCPGLIKQSKLHRFRRGRSSQESPEPARIIKNHKLGISSDFLVRLLLLSLPVRAHRRRAAQSRGSNAGRFQMNIPMTHLNSVAY